MDTLTTLLARALRILSKVKSIQSRITQLKHEFAVEYASERIVEYPWVFRNLELDAGKILDVGCCKSKLSIQLASLGYKVYGIDISNYLYKHPNFKFFARI